MSQTVEAIRKLNDTTDTLRRYGWIQHVEGNRAIGFCLVGAMRKTSAYSNPVSKGIVQDLTGGIPTWNDHRKRKEREVYRLLRRARRRLWFRRLTGRG